MEFPKSNGFWISSGIDNLLWSQDRGKNIIERMDPPGMYINYLSIQVVIVSGFFIIYLNI